jgi:hypothetical protein
MLRALHPVPQLVDKLSRRFLQHQLERQATMSTAHFDDVSAREPATLTRVSDSFVAGTRGMPADDVLALRCVCYILMAIVSLGTLLMLGTVLYTL